MISDPEVKRENDSMSVRGSCISHEIRIHNSDRGALGKGNKVTNQGFRIVMNIIDMKKLMESNQDDH